MKSNGKSKTKEENRTDNNDNNSRGKREKTIQPTSPHKNRNKVTLKFLLQFFGGVLGIVGLSLHNIYSRYGMNIFLGHNWKDFNWTPYKWRKFIDDNQKTIAIIGGPHRGGTTILWESIKAHPEITGFGNTFQTGVDFSEGVLIQDVYPTFGIGTEFKNDYITNGNDETTFQGLGKYALNPNARWTKENKKEKVEDPTNMSKVLNRFAPHWNENEKFDNDGLTKAKVWVEKSPQNAVLSTFLEGLYNLPIQEDGNYNSSISKISKTSATKFIFMTRHPIANCYAIDKMSKASTKIDIGFEILLRNYIQMHKYMKMDEKSLTSPVLWVRLEDFVSNPSKELNRVFSFLDVAANDGIVFDILNKMKSIQSNPNMKYFKTWCEKGIIDHGHLIEKYANDLKALDLNYDMNIC